MVSPSLLIGLVLILGTHLSVDGAATCTAANQGACLDCVTAYVCLQTGSTLTPIEIACDSGTACQVKNNVGNCFAKAELTGTECKCADTFTGYRKDDYDAKKYLMCLPSDGPVSLTCPTGQTFDETASQCKSTGSGGGSDAPSTCKKSGFQTINGCSQYYACFPDPDNPGQFKQTDVSDCTAPQVFNVAQGKCVDTTIDCNSIPDSGAYMDPVECNAFHVCISKAAIGGKQCCEANKRFDSSLSKCVDASKVPDSSCPAIETCIDKSTLDGKVCSPSGNSTVTTPSSYTGATGSSSCSKDGYTPYPGNCSKYYSCRNGVRTVQECPGKLLFNKKINLCDSAKNVSGC